MGGRDAPSIKEKDMMTLGSGGVVRLLRVAAPLALLVGLGGATRPVQGDGCDSIPNNQP
jgi:hypothetical protein